VGAAAFLFRAVPPFGALIASAISLAWPAHAPGPTTHRVPWTGGWAGAWAGQAGQGGCPVRTAV